MARPPSWTDSQVEELKRLTAEGWGDSQIGSYIGKSRNAVIGKRHRLGMALPNRPEISEEERLRREQRRNERRAEYARAQRLYAKRRYEEPHNRAMAQIVAAIPDLVPVERVSLINLQDHHCRWRLDDKGEDGLYLFCGRQTAHKTSWCEHHWYVVVYGSGQTFLQAAE